MSRTSEWDKPLSTRLADAGVSPREAEILDALGERLTNAEIAARLHVSIRTVEGHVSSLLRKLGAADRAALAELVDQVAASRPSVTSRPIPLTPLVGRAAERAQLAAALDGQRLVTAVGPGGVGKTRLATAVADDVADRYPDGVWHVDLIPVTQPARVAAAVAHVLQLGDLRDRTAEDAVAAALADRAALLVLDNCEHLVEAVAELTEHLLSRCGRLVVLATSRRRMCAPYERVFTVPGLSLPDGPSPGNANGDAVALFEERAATAGRPIGDDLERRRVGRLCRALDGNALAIELAAARLPTLGLDGLEAGIDDQLRLLSSGPRKENRHGSLRATLELSYELASPVDRAVLRRLSVFAGTFPVEAAAAVAGCPPVATDGDAAVVADAIGRLAEQSLVVTIERDGATSYRVLESVRQLGRAKLQSDQEHDHIRARHLRYSQRAAATLLTRSIGRGQWRNGFDAVADDLRSALGWAAGRADCRAEAHELAASLGCLAFRRGLVEESQAHFEQAAALAGDDEAVDALEQAAHAACLRHAGDDAFRLYQAAASAARDCGRRATAARLLAAAVTLARRLAGMFATVPPAATLERLLVEARALTGDDPRATVAVDVAAAFAREAALSGDDGLALVARSEAVGDPLLSSAALDLLTVVRFLGGDLVEAARTTERRIELLASLPDDVATATEVTDAATMAVTTHMAIGELAAAHRHVAALAAHAGWHGDPFREVHLVDAAALAGRWEPALATADRFLALWERRGRPVIPTFAASAAAIAMIHGLRGDDGARARWLAIAAGLRPPDDPHRAGREVAIAVFNVHVLLHRGQADDATRCCRVEQDEPCSFGAVWWPWYVALRAEAAALAGHDDAPHWIERARRAGRVNRAAAALAARTDAWWRGDADALVPLARELEAAGCTYQAARTLLLAGGEARRRGEQLLTDLGAGPMVVPAGPRPAEPVFR